MTIDDIKNLVSADESRTLELKKSTGELKDGMHSACALLLWNRTHKAAVSKQVKIKPNPFEMSGFSLFCQMPETQRSAEY